MNDHFIVTDNFISIEVTYDIIISCNNQLETKKNMEICIATDNFISYNNQLTTHNIVYNLIIRNNSKIIEIYDQHLIGTDNIIG